MQKYKMYLYLTMPLFETVIAYAGEFGISTHPESLVAYGNYRYWADAKRGIILRKGQSGIEIISNYGMRNWFREFLRKNYRKPIFGQHDPHTGQYTLLLEKDETPVTPIYNCGNELIKSNQKEGFTYFLQLNDLSGDIVINYDITQGQADIKATFNGRIYAKSHINGIGDLTIPRDSLQDSKVKVTIEPVSENISYRIINVCPVGQTVQVVEVVISNVKDANTSIVNRYKWGNSNFYSQEINFTDQTTRIKKHQGIIGAGRYPLSGKKIIVQSYKDDMHNGHFEPAIGDRMGYIVSDTVFTQDNIQGLLNNAIYPTITTDNVGNEQTHSIQFDYQKTGDILYLIWDYSKENTPPVAVDDTVNTKSGKSIIINVLNNDTDLENDTLTPIIVSPPTHGTAVLNADKTITYTHDGTKNYEDSFTYKLNDGRLDSNTANVNIGVGVDCSEELNANGGVGIYELTMTVGTGMGMTGITYDAYGIPDRFQIIYEGRTVADTKYVGSKLEGDPPTTGGLVGEHRDLPVYKYDGDKFVKTTIKENVTVTQSDIANGTTEPASGQGKLLFNKTTKAPTLKIKVTAPINDTSWKISGICPSSPTSPTDNTTDSNTENTPPVVVNNTETVVKGEHITIPVLNNDTDADGDNLKVLIVRQPERGTAVVNTDNTITYTNDISKNDANTDKDTFTYKVNDGTVDSLTEAQVTVLLVDGNVQYE